MTEIAKREGEIISGASESKEERIQPFSTEDVSDTDLFIGNLRPDFAPRILVTRMQDLFMGIGIKVADNQFKCVHKGTKRPKHLFVRLESVEDKKKAIERFDGLADTSVSMEGKLLKVKSRLNKKCKGGTVKSQDGAKTQEKNEASCPLPLKFGVCKGPVASASAAEVLNKRNLELSKQKMVNTEAPAKKTGKFFIGQILQNEDRITEYKRGTGSYLNKILVRHVRKYVCAFLNSEGGRLIVGVSDDGVVRGIPCSRKQEDSARLLIDNVIKGFHPHIFPDVYSVTFFSVQNLPPSVQSDEVEEEPLKILEIKVKQTHDLSSLYENDKGEVYIRRDGSVQGPLKASQIMEWCRLRYAKDARDDRRGRQNSFDSLNYYSSQSTSSSLSNDSQNSKDGVKKRVAKLRKKERDLIRMEKEISKRQQEIEKQLAALQENSDDAPAAKSSKRNSASRKSESRKRPSSAVCILF